MYVWNNLGQLINKPYTIRKKSMLSHELQITYFQFKFSVIIWPFNITQYYKNENNNIHVTLHDDSQAFDIVIYRLLFKLCINLDFVGSLQNPTELIHSKCMYVQKLVRGVISKPITAAMLV